MTEGPARVYTLLPAVNLGFALVSAPLALGVALVPGLPLGARWGVVIFLITVATLHGWVVARRWGTLTVGETVRYQRRKLRFELPRTAAVAVRVLRGGIATPRPVTYTLVLRVNGKDHALPFAEHWAFGKEKRRSAQDLAGALGVPFQDPRAEDWATSAVPLYRWVANGEEWKVWAAVSAVLLAAGGVAAALAG